MHEQKFLAHLTNGSYSEIESSHGHDGFLIENVKLTGAILDFWHQGETEKSQVQRGTQTQGEGKLVQLSLN